MEQQETINIRDELKQDLIEAGKVVSKMGDDIMFKKNWTKKERREVERKLSIMELMS